MVAGIASYVPLPARNADRVRAALPRILEVRGRDPGARDAMSAARGCPSPQTPPGVGTAVSNGQTLTSAMPDKGAGCEEVNYDPLVMGDGIAPTRDPVLRFRSPSYGGSAGRRLQGQ
jgi:hypothetical protein